MSSSIHSHLFQRIASALAAWRRRQQDRRQMLAMSDAELRDLGIGRGQIPALLETVPSQHAPLHAASACPARITRMTLQEKTA